MGPNRVEGLQGTLSWPQEQQKISGVSREPARTQQQQLATAELRAAEDISIIFDRASQMQFPAVETMAQSEERRGPSLELTWTITLNDDGEATDMRIK